MSSENDEIIAQILSDFDKNDKLKRRHANFWQFWKKSVKESGVFEEFQETLSFSLKSIIKTWRIAECDPPDIEVELENGKVVGVELTELVNKEAIEAQIENPSRYTEISLSFDAAEAFKKIDSIIKLKMKKLRKIKNSYSCLLLLIHTDEIMLTSEGFAMARNNHIFAETDVFNSVYIIFSYEPASQSYPVIKLS